MKKILLIILVFLFSCEDSGILPNYGCTSLEAENFNSMANLDDGSCIQEYTYTWNNDISPIFSACIECHDFSVEMIINGNLNPDNNEMFRRINLDPVDSDFMPQGYDPLTDYNIEKIRIWLLEGAPE